MRFFTCLTFVALLGAALPTHAQSCPSLVDSPILSNSVDDVPAAAGVQVITYQGAYASPRPNHQLAFIQINSNEQKVWFTIDVGFKTTLMPVFYNRRYRADANSPWYWEFSASPIVTSPGGFPNCVLYSATPRFAASDGVYYKYIMYMVYQPHSCDGKVMGFGTFSLSNDGICWTSMKPLHHSSGPSAACAPDLGSNLVQVEAISAIDNGAYQIFLLGMEGDAPTLANANHADWPYLSWGYAAPYSVDQVVMDFTVKKPGCEPYLYGSMPSIEYGSSVSKCGLVDMYTSELYDSSNPTRFHPYSYFFNMTSAWDAASGDIYVTRAYPYPYDRHALTGQLPLDIPSDGQRPVSSLFNSVMGSYQDVQGCGDGNLAGYPNRYQIYRMHLGDLSVASFTTLNTAYWTFVSDNGGSVGYGSNTLTRSAYLNSVQTAGSFDAGAASFLRDGAGLLVRTGTSATVLAGNTVRSTLSSGPCYTTGAERIFAVTLP
jgi:hypothetical protein